MEERSFWLKREEETFKSLDFKLRSEIHRYFVPVKSKQVCDMVYEANVTDHDVGDGCEYPGTVRTVKTNSPQHDPISYPGGEL